MADSVFRVLGGKTPKKTTFSLNQTTWSDNARPQSEADSDSMSESSEASLERKQFSDVKILLEEKRKASLLGQGHIALSIHVPFSTRHY